MLVSIEAKDVPFPINRVYYILAAEGASRGFHAHRRLDQLMICVKGSCRLIVDDGRERREVTLDRPDRGLHIGRMQWREMHDFTADSVVLVLASAPHDEADYIRDYESFLAETRAQSPA
ncbi:MAG: WxcM-like domain-containing protein [Sphingomonas sp.]|nr:WxcM-like domain-containing protein [Sphingomonas sp.]